MEALAPSSASASSSRALLAHAFGRQLLEGADEWCGVADVVRSSFLLLYGEVRRQHKQLTKLQERPAPPPPSSPDLTLLKEQLTLVREELQLTQAELAQVRETRRPQCTCQQLPETQEHAVVRQCVRVFATRHETLRRDVTKLERKLSRTRRGQHECEEIVVRAAEQHTRRLRRLQHQVDAHVAEQQKLHAELTRVVTPKLATLETHVVATQRALKRLHGHVRDLHEKVAERDELRCGEEGTVPHDRTGITQTERPHDTHDDRIVELPIPHEHSFISERDERDEETEMYGEQGDTHATVPQDHEPPIAHVSLRRRYQRERTRQLHRLDRLRHIHAITGNNAPEPSYPVRSKHSSANVGSSVSISRIARAS